MNFQFTPLTRYLSGLAILAIIAVILFLAQDLVGLQGPGAIGGLVTGMLIGQLVASVKVSRAARKPANSRASSQTKSPRKNRKTIYVGNIAYNANRFDLENLFTSYGDVYSARIMKDRATHKPRGYGFVEMGSASADKAIAALNGTELNGRALKVGEATERNPG